jgi:hypothetical protein
MRIPTLRKFAVAIFVLAVIAGCSQSTGSSPNGKPAEAALPEEVVGTASWDDHPERPIHRVSCEFEPPFYRFRAEGLGFELAVGFWGDDADQIEEVDFNQADSVELTEITAEEVIYRYTTLRFLPEMGPIRGSTSNAQGRTKLRPTSLAALTEYDEGIDLDFEFKCPASDPGSVAES